MAVNDSGTYQCPLVCCRFRLRFESGFSPWPFMTTTFRGGLGYVLKRLVCGSTHKQCASCLICHNCAYSYLFETEPHENAEIMRKYNHVPHPFVLCAVAPRESPVGEYLGLETTLIGNGTQFLPHFLYAVIELGKTGLGRNKTRYVLEEASVGGQAEPIYRENDTRIRGHIVPEVIPLTLNRTEEADISRWRLELLTPLRLIHEGKLLSRPLMRPFVATLLRRASALLHFHCGQTLQVDFADLVHRAARLEIAQDHTRWQEQERYSTRQNERMKLGGLVGRFDVIGNLAPFEDLLRLGERIHNGKGTVFGLGKYTMERIADE